jgi:hypothetical protein
VARDLTIVLEDKPGARAELGEAVGRAGINLGGGCAVVTSEGGVIHLLVDDEQGTRAALDQVGIGVREARDVLVMDVQDQPGTLGSYARKLADAGVNIDLFYIATGTRLVFGADDLDAARAALA